MDETLLTAFEVGKILNTKTETVLRYARSGKIPAHKVGSMIRFKREEVLEALKPVNMITKEEIFATHVKESLIKSGFEDSEANATLKRILGSSGADTNFAAMKAYAKQWATIAFQEGHSSSSGSLYDVGADESELNKILDQIEKA